MRPQQPLTTRAPSDGGSEDAPRASETGPPTTTRSMPGGATVADNVSAASELGRATDRWINEGGSFGVELVRGPLTIV